MGWLGDTIEPKWIRTRRGRSRRSSGSPTATPLNVRKHVWRRPSIILGACTPAFMGTRGRCYPATACCMSRAPTSILPPSPSPLAVARRQCSSDCFPALMRTRRPGIKPAHEQLLCYACADPLGRLVMSLTPGAVDISTGEDHPLISTPTSDVAIVCAATLRVKSESDKGEVHGGVMTLVRRGKRVRRSGKSRR